MDSPVELRRRSGYHKIPHTSDLCADLPVRLFGPESTALCEIFKYDDYSGPRAEKHGKLMWTFWRQWKME
ncbi:Hypp7356 [Branchiostoma lanceolatum]|uniref:Hypp7356 protein n=1 Tax=Branchiostoma lanceolatum TaxID=7740 RepID=A0A8K0EB18_BRALA|nr:Hypp7356 [Branchiostoma lanceolatum]